jgi:enediyne biosynthesis protein E4
MNPLRTIVLIFSILLTESIQAQPLFRLVPESISGIRFTNMVKENDSLHIFKYEYLYNGHGIGVGDFDQDGLEDVFIAGNVTPNKLYLNRGKLAFEDITQFAGVKGNGAWRTGVSIADVNGDGWTDIYVCHSGPGTEKEQANELFIHQGLKNGKPVFKELAAEYGLDLPGTLSTQAAFFDYDLDGDLDMFLVNHSNHTVNPYLNTAKIRSTPNFRFGNRLFRNDRNTDGKLYFTDVTVESGIVNNALNFGLSVVVSDLNYDGWPDLYTSSDYTEQDYCYMNSKNGSFKQVLQQSFTHVSKYSMGADIADVNNDGLSDVFTLDMLPEDNFRQKLLKGPDEYDAYHLLLDSGYYHQQMRNMLHLNRGLDQDGNVRFSEIGQFSGISKTDWSWSAIFNDLDNDGWKDLMITNGYLRDFTDNDFLKYTVADEQLAQAAKGNLQFKTYDLVRKMPSNKLRNYLYKNVNGLNFADSSISWGFNLLSVSNAAVQADFDNDGDLDLLIGNNNEPVQFYENTKSKCNWIQFSLKGRGLNTQAIGAKILLYSNGVIQYQELYPVRGYQSSGSYVLHFGLGNSKPDSAVLIWPDGSKEVMMSPIINKRHVFNWNKTAKFNFTSNRLLPVFKNMTKSSGLQVKHLENDFVDFKVEVLMPYQLSKMGPALASADVNRDGFMDIFIGGALGQSSSLFLQQANGNFILASNQPWDKDKDSEDVKALFFDVENDGDVDLYVVSGGNEYEEGSPEFEDRLYVNDGKGLFSRVVNALPMGMLTSKLSICAGDIDADGDLDLFIGGASIPGMFPSPARSYLLRNDSKISEIRFTDITKEWSEELLYPGIMHTVTFTDINKDGRLDLMLAGEWTTIQLYQNLGNKFHNVSEMAGFRDSGLWSSMLITDINKDGYLDVIAGNAGTNLTFQASEKEPVSLIQVDLDDNGQYESIFCYYIQGKCYPAASRDELLDQVVPLRKKFVKYHQYASITIDDLITPEKRKQADEWKLTELSSVVYLNDGDGYFQKEILPAEVQFSRVFSILPVKDKYILAGNFFPWRTQWGRSDASLGNLLSIGKDGKFAVEPNQQTGLFLSGDIRNGMIIPAANGKQIMILGVNNDSVQVWEVGL